MIKPLGNRVLLKPSTGDEKSSGGILLPDSAQRRPNEGTVVAVGPGKTLDDGSRAQIQVKEGDVCVYSQYAGTEVKIDGDEYILIEDDQILAVRE
jgi:chaperonin GroES